MQINEVIKVLRQALKEVKFDDIPNKLPTIDIGEVTGIDYKLRVVSCRVISDEVIDLDITTQDEPTRIDYTITLRKIVNYYPIPDTYITINKDTVMADNVEVFVGTLSDLISTDIVELSDCRYALATPVSALDIDFDILDEQISNYRNYSICELVDSIIDAIDEPNIRLRVLENIKGFYADDDYDEEE